MGNLLGSVIRAQDLEDRNAGLISEAFTMTFLVGAMYTFIGSY